MEFKDLSSAIADVINNYHAHKTETPLDSVDLDAPLEQTEQILREKILAATTGSNSQSSRRTLLEYMLFGIKLSERARVAESPDETETLKLQLVQFFQTILRLFNGPYLNWLNVHTSSTLFIPANETYHQPSLLIYYLNTPSSEAYIQTHALLITLGLSPESPATTVEKHLGELFFAKKHHVLLEENAELKAKIQTIKHTIKDYETQIDNITNKTIKTTTTYETSAQVDEKKAPAETEAHHWEMVGFNSEDEKVQHLLEKNEKLQKRHEELEERSQVLRVLLNGLLPSVRPTTRLTSKPTPRTCNQKSATSAHAHVITEQPTTNRADAANSTTRQRSHTTRTAILTNFLFPPQPYGCGYGFPKTEPDPSLDKSNKIN